MQTLKFRPLTASWSTALKRFQKNQISSLSAFKKLHQQALAPA